MSTIDINDILCIYAGDGMCYYISRQIYHAAMNRMLPQDSIDQFVYLAIDGYTYTDPKTIGIVLTAMYSVYHPDRYHDIILPLSRVELPMLPRILAILSWCRANLRDCAFVNNIRSAVLATVDAHVNTIRAIVAARDDVITGDRMSVLTESGLKIDIPSSLENTITIPCTRAEKARILCPSIGRSTPVYFVGERSTSLASRHPYIKHAGSRDTVSYADLVNLQAQVQNEIISRELRIVCYQNPQYMRIPFFGPECIAELRQIVPADRAQLYSCWKPLATIYDVFQFGLRAMVD